MFIMQRLFFRLFLLSLFVIGAVAVQAQPHKPTTLKPDGPYLLHNNDGSVRMIAVDAAGRLKDTLYRSLAPGFSFTVTSDNAKDAFTVTLKELQSVPTTVKVAGKIFVLSDPHGDWKSFISVLKANKIVDEQLNWSFGANTFVLNGDVFDRGNDATTILWLLYKLETEAQKAGGSVFYNIGNHENLVLKGDNRYIKKKYKILADSLKIAHKNLYAPNSELGQWLRKRNLIQIINDNLFVHAGLSSEIIDRNLTAEFINATVSKNLDQAKEQWAKNGDDVLFIYSTYGPVWYRGMASKDEKYRPASQAEVDKLLKYFGVRRIIIGHTIMEEVMSRYNGKVFAVNVDNSDNRKEGKSRGLLIDGKKTYLVYDSGKLVPIK